MTTVVLVAAGSGTRLGAGAPKAFVPMAGRSVLAWALEGVLAADAWARDEARSVLRTA